MSCMRHLLDFRAREFATFFQTRATASASRPRVKPDPSQPLAFSCALPVPPPPPPALPLPPLPSLPQLLQSSQPLAMPLASPPAVNTLRPSPSRMPLTAALPARSTARGAVDRPVGATATPALAATATTTAAVASAEARITLAHVAPFPKCYAPSSAKKRPRDNHEEYAHHAVKKYRDDKCSAVAVTSPTAVATVLNTTPSCVPSVAARAATTGTRSGSETEDGDGINSTAGYECDQCRAKFCRKHHRDRHVQNIHEGRRPWTCEQCGFAFHQKPNLERHIMTVHEEQKPFRCNVCGVSFGRKGVLKKHVQTVHEQSRKFECDKCSLHFGLKSDLKRHVLSVHQKQRPFVCETCSASFGRKSDLKRHTLSLHPGVALPTRKRASPRRRS